MKYYLFLIAMLATFVGYAHQSDLSTSVLSKTPDGKYVLQITSSLTAFEGEINYLYSKNAYKTADGFRDLVIDHFRKNVVFIVNDKDTLKFAQPLVILGHETKLVVEVLNIPADIKTIYYRNTMFKDMPHNQMAVILLTEGLPIEQYILENENKQTVQLELKEGKWNSIEVTKNILNTKNILYCLSAVLILIISTLVIMFNRNKMLKMILKKRS
jgi:hypothetical protein